MYLKFDDTQISYVSKEIQPTLRHFKIFYSLRVSTQAAIFSILLIFHQCYNSEM